MTLIGTRADDWMSHHKWVPILTSAYYSFLLVSLSFHRRQFGACSQQGGLWTPLAYMYQVYQVSTSPPSNPSSLPASLPFDYTSSFFIPCKGIYQSNS